MNRPTVEQTFEHAGLQCAVLAQSMGHRCGYVLIPEDHPWHGIGYNDEVPNPAPLDEEQTVDEFRQGGGVGADIALLCGTVDGYTRRMDGQVRVHGGLTFSGKGLPGVDEDGWWVGFDCAHAGDSKDEALMDEAHRRIYEKYPDPGGRVWDGDSVAAECRKLAEQIAAAFSPPNPNTEAA